MYSEQRYQKESSPELEKVYRLQPGQEIRDKTNRAYKLDRLLGEGGMGTVFEATNSDNGMKVAIKFIRPEYRNEQSLIKRFEREIITAAQFPSPFILFPIDRIEVPTIFGETVGFVTEFVKGTDLLYELNQSRFNGESVRMDPLLVCEYVSQIALAIAAMNRAGFIHRDLKLNNIFLQELSDGTKRVRVGDFGISGTSSDWDEEVTTKELSPVEKEDHLEAHELLTHPSSPIGSPHISSPELFRRENVTSKSDVFALGVMCYELLTGRSPFTEDYRQSVRDKILQTNPPSFAEQRAEHVPVVIQQLVMDMLSKDPSQRPSGMEVYTRMKKWIAKEHPEKLRQLPFDYNFEETSDLSKEEISSLKAA